MAHMNLYIIYNPILSDFFRQLKKNANPGCNDGTPRLDQNSRAKYFIFVIHFNLHFLGYDMLT